jgi:hypothetical protein
VKLQYLHVGQHFLETASTMWVTGTHHIILSIGFALQSLDYRSIWVRRVRKGCIPRFTNSPSPPRSPPSARSRATAFVCASPMAPGGSCS